MYSVLKYINIYMYTVYSWRNIQIISAQTKHTKLNTGTKHTN